MTGPEERTALAEVLAFAKEKGLKIKWTNDNIVVIHVSPKNLSEDKENQSQGNSSDA